MNSQHHSDQTVRYYDEHAATFSQGSLNLDIGHLYAEFLPLLSPGGTILDAGCGSGRDSAFFKQKGFIVTAFDASAELAALASAHIGESVKVMSFLELESADEFDGVWACASLLHLPNDLVGEALRRLGRSLKSGGFLYASFRYGEFVGVREGRFFNNYDEGKFATMMENEPLLRVKKIWTTHDVRPDREDEQWLNVILVRT